MWKIKEKRSEFENSLITLVPPNGNLKNYVFDYLLRNNTILTQAEKKTGRFFKGLKKIKITREAKNEFFKLSLSSNFEFSRILLKF